MSKVFAGYHLVFSTKKRMRTIPAEYKRKLYNYIFTVLQSKECDTIRINGMSDHIHIAFNLNPRIALADLVRDIKRSSSLFMTAENGFPSFMGWGEGYYAHTFSHDDKVAVRQYIMNQEEHHAGKALIEEMEWMALKQGLRFHENDWT